MAKDTPILFVRRKGDVLVPHARFDADLLSRYSPDVKLRAELTQPRSLPHQRWYWATLKAVCDATGRWPNAETLHKALKWHLGVVDELPSVKGKPIIVPGSTAFRAMDGAAFREYTQAAEEAITTEICPGLTLGDLLALGNARLGPDERRAA